MNNYYNYIYLDLSKPGLFKYNGLDYIFQYEPFYIGKGKNKRLALCAHKHKSYIYNKINKLTQTNILIFKIYDNLSEDVALKNEVNLIKIIGKNIDKKGPLCNLTNGGEGISGYKHTEITKYKISIACLNRKVSDATKLKLSLINTGCNHPNYGKTMSKEHKDKLIKALKNKKQTLEHITKCKITKYKEVEQIDLITKNIINTFKSLKDAKELTGIKTIGKVCLGQRNKAGGYFWRYKIK